MVVMIARNSLLIWAGLLVLCLLFPGVSAFEYVYGENKTIYPHCFNATDGALLGTNANLTIRNETGVFYLVKDLQNEDTGIFSHNLTNLSKGHCYSLDLVCEDADTWISQWATLCVESEDDYMIFAALILAPLIMAFLVIFAAFKLDPDDHFGLQMALLLIGPLAFWSSLHLGTVAVIEFYDGFPEFQDAVGTASYWVGWFFFLLASYIFMYVLLKIIVLRKEKKKRKLEYGE